MANKETAPIFGGVATRVVGGVPTRVMGGVDTLEIFDNDEIDGLESWVSGGVPMRTMGGEILSSFTLVTGSFLIRLAIHLGITAA